MDEIDYFWIKERHDPQFGVYYVAMGHTPIKEAMNHEKTAYGLNIMHRYATEAVYLNRLQWLKDQGYQVQEATRRET